MSKTTGGVIEQRAKAAALAHINHNRAADGLKPMNRITPLWWRMYGAYWVGLEKAKVEAAQP